MTNGFQAGNAPVVVWSAAKKSAEVQTQDGLSFGGGTGGFLFRRQTPGDRGEPEPGITEKKARRGGTRQKVP